MALAPWLARAIASAPPWEARVPAPLSLASGRGGGVTFKSVLVRGGTGSSRRPRWRAHCESPGASAAWPGRPCQD